MFSSVCLPFHHPSLSASVHLCYLFILCKSSNQGWWKPLQRSNAHGRIRRPMRESVGRNGGVQWFKDKSDKSKRLRGKKNFNLLYILHSKFFNWQNNFYLISWIYYNCKEVISCLQRTLIPGCSRIRWFIFTYSCGGFVCSCAFMKHIGHRCSRLFITISELTSYT